jgi:hypothetical protein
MSQFEGISKKKNWVDDLANLSRNISCRLVEGSQKFEARGRPTNLKSNIDCLGHLSAERGVRGLQMEKMISRASALTKLATWESVISRA